jgi:ATP-binding cassette subfamily F protein 2
LPFKRNLQRYIEANHANGKAKSAASKDKVLNKIKSEAVEVGLRIR